MHRKSFSDLTVDDIKKHSTWRFTNESSDDELEIEAVIDRPCFDLDGLIVGTDVLLADGSRLPGLIQNINAWKPERNDHFLTLTVDNDGRWFSLARYHDVDFADHGPEVLSVLLKKYVNQIFPINYDVRRELGFDAPGLVGAVRAEPTTRLTRKEIIALALSK